MVKGSKTYKSEHDKETGTIFKKKLLYICWFYMVFKNCLHLDHVFLQLCLSAM